MRPCIIAGWLSVVAVVILVDTARADFIIDNFTNDVFTQNSTGVINNTDIPTSNTIGGARSINYN